MSEERATYEHRPRPDPDEDVQHIGDILDQFIEDQNWSDRLAQARNGHVPTKNNGRHRG